MADKISKGYSLTAAAHDHLTQKAAEMTARDGAYVSASAYLQMVVEKDMEAAAAWGRLEKQVRKQSTRQASAQAVAA